MTEKERKNLFNNPDSWKDYRTSIDLNVRKQKFAFKDVTFVRIIVLEHVHDWQKEYGGGGYKECFKDEWNEKALYRVDGMNYYPISRTEAFQIMKEKENGTKRS